MQWFGLVLRVFFPIVCATGAFSSKQHGGTHARYNMNFISLQSVKVLKLFDWVDSFCFIFIENISVDSKTSQSQWVCVKTEDYMQNSVFCWVTMGAQTGFLPPPPCINLFWSVCLKFVLFAVIVWIFFFFKMPPNSVIWRVRTFQFNSFVSRYFWLVPSSSCCACLFHYYYNNYSGVLLLVPYSD